MKSRETIVLLSEDSHDVNTISIIEALIKLNKKFILIVPLSKRNRLIDYEYYNSENIRLEFITYNIISDYISNRTKVKLINKIAKLIDLIGSILFILPIVLFRLKKINIIQLIILENYTLINKLLSKFIILRYKKKIRTFSFVIHNVNIDSQYIDSIYKKIEPIDLKNIIYFYEPLKSSIVMAMKSKPIHCIIPFSTTNEFLIKERMRYLNKNNEKIRYVIPGNIEVARRDYLGIFIFFENLKIPYELILAGKLIDQIVIDKANENNINIKFYDHFINQREYDELILSSDFIVYKNNPDLDYGSNKIAGVIYDSNRYGVPILYLNQKAFNYNNSYLEISSKSEFELLSKKYLLDKFNNKLIINALSIMKYNTTIDYLIEYNKIIG